MFTTHYHTIKKTKVQLFKVLFAKCRKIIYDKNYEQCVFGQHNRQKRPLKN